MNQNKELICGEQARQMTDVHPAQHQHSNLIIRRKSLEIIPLPIHNAMFAEKNRKYLIAHSEISS